MTPFEVFVFSDASPVTADMSTASGFIFVCLVLNCKPLFDIFCVHQYKNGLLIASSCFYIIKCARRQPSTFYGIEIGKKVNNDTHFIVKKRMALASDRPTLGK